MSVYKDGYSIGKKLCFFLKRNDNPVSWYRYECVGIVASLHKEVGARKEAVEHTNSTLELVSTELQD